jgi:hypothetical protein
MGILKSFTLKWWETSLFKICSISLGIIIGATWPEIFLQWRSALLLVVVLPGLYLTWIWWKQ